MYIKTPKKNKNKKKACVMHAKVGCKYFDYSYIIKPYKIIQSCKYIIM